MTRTRLPCHYVVAGTIANADAFDPEELKKKLKRWLGLVAAIFAVIFIALNVAAYRQAYAMTHFVAGGPRTAPPERLNFGQKLKTVFCGIDLPRARTTLLPASLGPDCRKVSFAGANGMRLGAWYCPVSPDRPLVILFHGYGGEKTSTLNEARVFLEMGLSVLLVDFRGSGDSSESYTTIGYDEAQDVAAAVRYAQANLPHSKLVLYGISMGAAAVLRAVHNGGIQPDAIIAEAVFDRMLATVRNRFESMGVPSFPAAELLVFWGGRQFGFNGFGHNPVEYAASVRCPILFLHGAADPRAHLAEARRVYDAVPGRKWFKEFPGIGHAATVVPCRRQWKETVWQFLKDAQVEAETPASLSRN
ncbi:MAG: alpha/beta fold hydrolase [Verrucomicrobiota bacterium]